MPPFFIVIVIGAAAAFLLSKAVAPVKSTPVTPPANSALGFGMPDEATAAVLPLSGVQSLTGPEKVALFSDMQRRWIVERGKAEGGEILEFATKDALGRLPPKAGEAMDVLYGANMGFGVDPHAILVKKTEDGKTAVLAVSDGNWIARARTGSPWNVFLRPGEAREVAKAAGVKVVDRLPSNKPVLMLAATTTPSPVDGSQMVEGAPVVMEPVTNSSDLAAVLPSAGFGGSQTEALATTAATDLPGSWQSIGDVYRQADDLHSKGDVGLAKAQAEVLSGMVVPLRSAGYALASSQVQTLLSKVGADA